MVLKTKILKNTEKNIILASSILKNNNLVGIPTETVYGLAGRADNDDVVRQIYNIKNSPFQ